MPTIEIAEVAERESWSIEPHGIAVYWSDLDDGLEVVNLLDRHPL